MIDSTINQLINQSIKALTFLSFFFFFFLIEIFEFFEMEIRRRVNRL